MIFKTTIISLLTIIVFCVIGCKQDISSSKPPVYEKLEKAKIISNPSNAEVYQDEVKTGYSTPCIVDWLGKGEYEFTLKRKFYQDTSFTIKLYQDSIALYEIDYTKNLNMLGKIECKTEPPGAQIVLNDTVLDKITPDTLLNVLPGKNKIKFVNHGWRADSVEVEVYSGQTAFAHKPLIDTSLIVDYNIANSKILSNYLSCVHIDTRKEMWIGTINTGVFKFDGFNVVEFNELNSVLPSNNVKKIVEDKLGVLWFATVKGLASFDGSHWKIYEKTEKNGLPSKNITNICFDSKNRIWLATELGLVFSEDPYLNNWNDAFFYNAEGEKISAFDSTYVVSIAEDNFGVLWCGLKNGDIWYSSEEGRWLRLKDDPDQREGNFVNAIGVVDDNILFGRRPDLESTSRNGGFNLFEYTLGNISDGTWTRNAYNILGDNINAIKVYENEILVCSDSGFYIIADNKKELYHKNNSNLNSKWISDSVIDSDGNVWITTFDYGLYKLKRQ